MISHRIFEVSWLESGRRKVSHFVEVSSEVYAEVSKKAGLEISHDGIHDLGLHYPLSCIKPKRPIGEYYDSSVPIRTVYELQP